MNEPFGIEWHGDAVVQEVENQLARNLDLAAQSLRDEIVDNLSKPSLSNSEHPGRVDEYPRAASGELSRRIFSDASALLTRRVLTDVHYGLWLELGTRHMAARPFLTRTLNEVGPRIAHVITRIG